VSANPHHPEPDPALIAEIEARSTARRAHHEAGHVVAVVVRGGDLLEVFLGTTDWSNIDAIADTPGGTRHRSAWEAQPFVTFAGPWAEAMWYVEQDPDLDDLDDALDYAWEESADGDTAKYESRLDLLNSAATGLGFGPVGGRGWEWGWREELEELWPVVCQVAALLIDGGQAVTHEVVRSLLDSAAAAADE
jgi:hypothetical protein